MTPLGEHESNNRLIDDFIRAIADELGLNLKKMGSLTLKREGIKKGCRTRLLLLYPTGTASSGSTKY
jgi:Uma2 family endonuclease